MSRPRLLFILALGSCALAWSILVFISYDTRADHRAVLMKIYQAKAPVAVAALDAAINDYENSMALVPCNNALHEDMSLLLAQRADSAMTDATTDDEDVAMEAMQSELASHLACSPMDGKAWLDIATMMTYREGVTPRALSAYRMSANVAPGESWLAEKRLLFALQFRPVLDNKSRDVAKQDIAVLGRAHPNRMATVMKAASVENETQLAALLAGQD